ncbi:MAG: MFS transporter [Anaerolineales bacterium]|nr:MFS transporter [Anaerolineales bacterium]
MNRPASSRYLFVLTTLLMLVSIINIADKELLSPVVDAVKADLNLTDTHIGTVHSAVFFASFIGLFFWGPLSDKWVRKNIIVIGTIIWSAITWMTAFAGNFPQLLLTRAGMSFAEGCFNPSSFALITDAAPKKKQGMLLGLMTLTYPIGAAVSLVAVSAIGAVNWRKPFVVFGIVGIILGALVWLFVREPQRGANEEAVQARHSEYSGHFSLAEFFKILKTRSLLFAFMLDTCQTAINWCLALWVPTYLTRYNIAPTAETAALALLPGIVGFVLGALAGGWLNDRLRTRTALAPAWITLTSMGVGAFAAILMLNIFSLNLWMASLFLVGFITYPTMPTVNIIFFSIVPPEMKASTISTSNIIMNLVVAIMSYFIGRVSDAAGLRPALLGVLLTFYGLGILASLGLFRTYGKDMEKRNEFVEAHVA